MSEQAPGARVGIVYDEIYTAHDTGPGHPERPGRCDAVITALESAAFADRLERLTPCDATDEEILACHTAEYWETVRRDIEQGFRMLSTGDTHVSPKSLAAALKAAGGVTAAVDAVIGGKVSHAFCVVRPPGHHVTRTRGMGFCVFNNAAIAARYAQRTHGIGKVLIADWDVHHGNGTQDIFYEDPSVFFFSTHQWPLYPGTGDDDETGYGPGAGTTMNIPVPAGTGIEKIGAAFETLAQKMQQFKPELVIVSAGFDSRIEDPLGGLALTDANFAQLTRMVTAIAREHCDCGVVSTLEGGYNLKGLGLAARAHVGALVEG